MECIFCKIIDKEKPSEIVYEDDEFLVVKDIHPKAPVHLLLIPKIHIASVNDLNEGSREMAGGLFLLAKKIALANNVSDGYKLLINVGRKGGQLIDHLHLHLMGSNSTA